MGGFEAAVAFCGSLATNTVSRSSPGCCPAFPFLCRNDGNWRYSTLEAPLLRVWMGTRFFFLLLMSLRSVKLLFAWVLRNVGQTSGQDLRSGEPIRQDGMKIVGVSSREVYSSRVGLLLGRHYMDLGEDCESSVVRSFGAAAGGDHGGVRLASPDDCSTSAPSFASHSVGAPVVSL
jgi:hypothetical protein